MQQQVKQTFRRKGRLRTGEEDTGLWPLSAREFVKLPATSLGVSGRPVAKHDSASKPVRDHKPG
ncbi:hypothetical protein YTPLAS18_16170 [Nitrospira sp.]|nr:hypothetical protein YTPLAS18_16170 [Nitrospira sp.]